ncbi:AEC family transporter [Bhargavaea ullalensis]|uniref:Permease n=1 Tax=Bhargavaea ullalensis TaxID=1265685 RepID=A0ABV2GAB0_9BACL
MKTGGYPLSVSAFLLAMSPLYLMAAAGFAGRRLKVLGRQANGVITQLLLYITLPALILFSLDTPLSAAMLADFAWLVAMSAFVLTVSVFMAGWLRRRALLPDGQKSVYESLIVFGNQGFIGFAVSYILMGEQGIVYLTLFNICYLVLIWTYGIFLFTRDKPSVNWRVLFLNPGILATVVGVVMLVLPFGWPEILSATFEDVGKMTIPLSMILIGSLLAETRLSDLREFSRNVHLWIASSFKLLILPLTLLVFILIGVPYPLLVIAVLTAGMPSAATTTVYAQKFGGDAVFASYGVIHSTIFCVLTIPLLYGILQWLHGWADFFG